MSRTPRAESSVVCVVALALGLAFAPLAIAQDIAGESAAEEREGAGTEAADAVESDAVESDAAEGDAAESDAAESDAAAEAVPEPSAGQEAALRFQSGSLARRRGELERALGDFRSAQELSPSPEHLLAIAEVLDALRRDRELAETYRALLASTPDGPRSAEVRARLAILELRATRADEEAEAAREAEAEREAEAQRAAEEEAAAAGGSIFEDPWFWVVAGVVVLGGLGAWLLSDTDPGVEEPLPGDEGVVVGTLVEWP